MNPFNGGHRRRLWLAAALAGGALCLRPAEAHPQQPGLIHLEGTLEIRVEDRDAGSVVHYVLETGTGRVELVFDTAPGRLETGDHLRVTGVREPDGRVRVLQFERDTGRRRGAVRERPGP